jgi:FkbM family methyltransferase
VVLRRDRALTSQTRVSWSWRAKRTARFVTSPTLTARGRLALLQVALLRRWRIPVSYRVALRIGCVFIDGRNARIDMAQLTNVLIDEVYARLGYERSVVIDVGAHKGYSAAYALMKGAQRVLCFEPEATNVKYLERAAASLHSRGVMEIHAAAVSDNDGEVLLNISDEPWAHSLVAGAVPRQLATASVVVRSLEGVIRDAKRRFPSTRLVLKINAEGAECPMLRNTPALFLRELDEILFEYHHFAECSVESIAIRLEEIGYTRDQLMPPVTAYHQFHHFYRTDAEYVP